MDTSRAKLIVFVLVSLMMDVGAAMLDDFGGNEARDPLEPQWSTWSEWAPCSRTCDGGATYQTRRCMDTVRGCGINGRSIRYQICNMQPCPEMVDFRLQQCQNYNSIPYQGKLYNWVPIMDKSTPTCSLSCRAVNTSLVVQHAARVHDGTRCNPGSLDMCIDGICQPVGCDLQLNSDSKVDACGVCGGDGSTCADSSDDLVVGYRWDFGHRLSTCTASCDGGEQEVEIICRDAVTGLEVHDQTLCDPSNRPAPKIVQCHTDPCPPKWIVGPWEACSVTCGGGTKERRVYCQQGRNNSKVDDVICSALIGHKARTHEPCNTHDCPSWFQGPWSQCSTSCGDGGVQTRVVVCRDARGHVTNACRPQDQPQTSRPCPSQPACPSTVAPPTTVTAPNRPPRQKVTPFSLFDDGDEEEEEDEKEEDEKELKGVLVQQPTGSISSGSVPSALLSEKLQVGEISLVPTDPTLALYYACGWFYKSFIAGEWSPCSVTCGDGTREREVNCKIFLEFSKTIAKLPDKECPGLKPAEIEPCFMRPCSLSNKYEPWIDQFSDQSNYKLMLATRKPVEDLRAATKMELTSGSASGGPVTVTKPSYSAPPSVTAPLLAHTWKSSGFSQCSASCLGGVQESIIECVREQDGQRVSPHLCPMERRPDAITRTCNDVPCPPRWNTSDFSTCSRTCGGGVQTREVHCIHEVARGGSNTLPVGADLCPQPPPRAQQFCNMIDCPVEWKTGEWSQCSSTCDGGFKVRKVSCQQLLALGQVLTKTANHCNPTSRPAESKPCNTGKPCTSNSRAADEQEEETRVTTTSASAPERSPLGLDLPKIQSTNQNFVQQSQSKKKVTLKIGGKATVFKGTQIKIRCPVKHYDKSKINWMKDHILLVKSQKYELNKKGMLRIRDATYSDSGVYSCIAGRSAANITVTVRPAPTASTNLENDWDSSTLGANGNRSKVDGGHVKHRVHPSGASKADESPRRSSSGDGSSWPSSVPVGERSKQERQEEDEEEETDDVVKEMKGNSLVNNGHKSGFDHRAKVAGQPNAGETFTSATNGPLYPDQDQDWHRQTSHYTYVTRARTTRSPPTRSTTNPTTTTTTTESPATTSGRADDNEEEEIPFDEEEDDYRSERRTIASNWPDRIDPIPTFWPTSNWWGSIDPIRNDGGSQQRGGQSRQSNRIPTYAPPPPNNNNNNRNRADNGAGGGGGGGGQVARSSSSRPSPPPYLQWLLAGLVQLLWPLQHQPEVGQPSSSSAASKNSKNAGNGRTGGAKHGGHNRSKLRNASASHHGQQHQKSGANKSASHPASAGSPSAVVLGKGKADSLKFEWLLTPWSKCSQTCGGSGFQVRAVQCIARLNNVTKSVEASLCEDAGLANPDDAGSEVTSALTVRSKQPATVQKCGLDTCPRWVAASWTPCHQSRCFTWNTALQKRQLDCVMDNGTLLDPLLCNDRDKPSQKRECFNENCRGAWKVSEWSHCSATCGSIGHQSRMLRCVWHGTDSPAGLACADLPRLPVTRPCRGPSCPLRGQCRDQSSHCGLVQTLELCYIPRYRQHCCQTCHHHQLKETDHFNRSQSNRKKKKRFKNPTDNVNASSTDDIRS